MTRRISKLEFDKSWVGSAREVARGEGKESNSPSGESELVEDLSSRDRSQRVGLNVRKIRHHHDHSMLLRKRERKGSSVSDRDSRRGESIGRTFMLKGPGLRVNVEPPRRGSQAGSLKSVIGRTQARIFPIGKAMRLGESRGEKREQGFQQRGIRR